MKKGISTSILAIVIVIVIVIAGVAVYFFATAPGPSSSTTTTTPTTSTATGLSGSITATAEVGYNDAALEAIAADYMAAHPGTTIHVVTLPFMTAAQSYQAAFSTGTDTYDVVFFPTGGYLGAIGQYLITLDQYVNNPAYFPASYNYSDMIPTAVAAFDFGNHLVGLPTASDAMLFYYRPSVFANATNQQEFQAHYGYQLPNPASTTLTLNQMVDVSTFFNGAHGFRHGIDMITGPGVGAMDETFTMLLAGDRMAAVGTYGQVTGQYGDLFSGDGKILTNTSLFINVANSYVSLLKASANPLTAFYPMIPGSFTSNDAPMMLFWTAPLLSLSNSSIGTDWSVARAAPGGWGETGGMALGIYSGTHNLPLALSFLEFATSPHESIQYVTQDSLIPFRYSTANYAVQHHMLSSEMMNIILNNLKYSVPGLANVSYWPQVETVLSGETALAYKGEISMQDAANLITQEAESSGATAW